MGLAALTMPEIVKMISSAALLCPISYLDHVSASFVLRAVAMHLDQVIYYVWKKSLNISYMAVTSQLTYGALCHRCLLLWEFTSWTSVGMQFFSWLLHFSFGCDFIVFNKLFEQRHGGSNSRFFVRWWTRGLQQFAICDYRWWLQK